jgi:glycosyltransferase involved in cell wall biosynthesis
MDISVIVCTYNRAESLKRALDSMLQMATPSNLTWELIVVDNNCTDATPQVVSTFARHAGFPVVYLFEKTPGLSAARNAGLARARGKIITYTDDDVVVDANWLVSIRKAFQDLDVAVVGGRVLLAPGQTFPSWWDPSFDGPFGKCDHGDQVRVDGSHHLNVIGANLSFRRSVFDQCGLFSSEIGRRGNALTMGEETELLTRILKLGHHVAYFPEALVYHTPSRTRMTVSYLRRWYYRRGEWEWYTTRHVGNPAGMAMWFGAPRWLYRTVLKNITNVVRYTLTGRIRRAIYSQMQLAFYIGSLAASIRHRSHA